MSTVSSVLPTHSRRRMVHVFIRPITSDEGLALTNFSYISCLLHFMDGVSLVAICGQSGYKNWPKANWLYPMFNRARNGQIWPHIMAEKGGLWPPSGYKLCQERQVIAPLATGFGPRLPQIARTKPANCQPKGINHPRLSAGNDCKIGKFRSKSEKIAGPQSLVNPVQERTLQH
jgi:hypothetical protein